ncbi:MAG TPA: hypothetical protein VE825_07920 [Terriglobales bacterium]|jgi:hypothetical protein|nr:hypothetical protein [Terriglobales bacterium]
MRKIYARNPKPQRKTKTRVTKQVNSRVPERALSFFKSNSELASSYILGNLRQLRRDERTAMEHHAIRVLRDKGLKSKEALRNGAVRLIVALLPKTFPALGELLSDSSSPLWYEVQFTAFCALDRDDLSEIDQRRVLTLIENYLMNVKSGSGYAAWKAGDLLGDEWNTPETVQILEKLLFSARHVAGRKAALHGMEHAIKKGTPSEREGLFSPIRKIASADPSAEVRKDAIMILEGVGCHHLSTDEASASGRAGPPQS